MTSFLWLWFQCVCPLATPTVLLGFLLPWTWGISSRLLQKSAAAAPYLGEGYLLTVVPPDLEHGIAPLGPPAPAQPSLLGHGVAPPGHRPCPPAWVNSSWPPPLASGRGSSSWLWAPKSLPIVTAAYEIKRHLLFGKKVMINLDSIFKSRDITLPTKVRLVKSMVFQWSFMDVRVGLWRRLSAEELMLLNCGVGEYSWESLGLQGDPTSPFWRRSVLQFLWKEWC